MSGIDIDPLDSTGRLKDAEEHFMEALEGLGVIKQEKTAIKKKASGNVFENENISPSLLYKILNSKFPEWLTWEPETVWSTIAMSMAQEPDEIIRNKIMAAKAVALSDDFFSEWHVFEKVVVAMNNIVPNFVVHETPTPGQMAYGVQEALKIKMGEFSDEIAAYVNYVLEHHGFVLYPSELSFAEKDEGDVVKKMKEQWVNMSDMSQMEPDSMESIQLQRLASVTQYINEKNSKGMGIK